MVDRCPPAELLPEIGLLSLSGEAVDPRRRHLEDCPRCRARLADYRDFMAGGADCPPAELATAMTALDVGLRAAIGATPRATGTEAARRGAEGHGRARILRGAFSHPLARLGFALAALFLLLVALDALPERPARREIRLRAGEDRSGAKTLVLEAPRSLPGGGVEFAWRPLAGADEYRLHLLAPDLSPLAEYASGGATWLQLSAAELAGLEVTGGQLVWQVEARAGGDPLAVSPPATYPLAADP